MIRHSILSPSTAARWTACPGSARAAAAAPGASSEYADEGSRAHAWAAAVLTGTTHHVAPPDDAEMARNVEIYTRHCRRLMDHADVHAVEAEVTLDALSPPTDMCGTCDFSAFFADRQELHIVDFKFGKGVLVMARNNPQLQYYAIGAMLHLGLPVETVITTVVQPRFQGADPIRSSVLSFAELVDFGTNLMARAREALRPDAPRVAGSHCKFCPARPSCPEYQRSRITAAYHEFAAADAAANASTAPADAS